MDVISIRVPAVAGYLGVLRSVLAGLAASRGASVDEIADLRLCVDEACATLLHPRLGATSLHLRVVVSDGGLEVVASVDARPARWPSADASAGVSWQVIAALSDDPAFVADDSGCGIRFTARLEAAGG